MFKSLAFITPCFVSLLLAKALVAQDISGDAIPNPYLESKVGDWVEMVSTSFTAGSKSTIEQRTTVTEKTKDQITIVTSAKFENGETEDFSQVIDLTKPFTLLTKLNYDPPGFPIFRNYDGSEEIKVKGKMLPTNWTSYTLKSKGFGGSQKKVWYCDQIPVGGLVKETMSTSYGYRSELLLVDWGFADPSDERASHSLVVKKSVVSAETRAIREKSKSPEIAYSITDLGTLGGDSSEARSLNDRGDVVGFSENERGIKRAFVYRDGKMSQIDADVANDINHDGVVVGSIKQGRGMFGSQKTTAFRWTQSSGIETGLIPSVNVGLSPKQLTGHARAINDRGDIAILGQGIAVYAILNTSGGQSVDLGHLGGMVSIPYDVNNKGEVVGYTKVGRTNVHGFLYRNGTMIDLGSLGRESGAHGINNKGEVVGSSKDRLANFRAFLWANGRMEDLGSLGGTVSNARDINDHSRIVGNSETSTGQQHGFVIVDDEMLDLNDVTSDRDGWEITDAYKINNSHQIAAVANRNGIRHAVLLSLATESRDSGGDAASEETKTISDSDSVAIQSNQPTPKLMPASSERPAASAATDGSRRGVREGVDYFQAKANLKTFALSTEETVAGQPPKGFKAIKVFATASPDFRRVAFTAETKDERDRCAVVDGNASPTHSIVNQILFSPDSKRYAYIAHMKDTPDAYLNVDGKMSQMPGANKGLQFSPDSQHVIYVSSGDMVTRNDGRARWMEAPGRVYFDGQPQRQYGMVNQIRVGGDSRTIAFSAMNQGQPVVVVDGKTVGTYSMLPGFPFPPAPLLSPNGKRSLFVAKRGGDWFVVVDQKESRETFKEIENLAFSPDSQHYAFGGLGRRGAQVHIDGAPIGPRVKRVHSRIRFSPDSSRHAVGVSIDDGATILVDGELQETFDVIGPPQFSPDSQRVAFYGEKEGECFIVCDEVKSEAFDDLEPDLVFSPDSSKLAYVGKRNGKATLFVNQEAIDVADEFNAMSITFSADSNSIAYWATRDEKYQLCVNGIASGVDYDEAIEASPNVIDYGNYQVDFLKFDSPTTLRAIGMNKDDKFYKAKVQIDRERIVDKTTFQAALTKGDRYGVLTAQTDLKDGKKTIGTAPKGKRFKVEDQNGDWLLGSFEVGDKEVRCWVSRKSTRFEI